MRRGAPCRGAPCAVVSPCRCLVTPVVRPSRQCPSVRSADLSWLRIDQVASDRWSLRTAPSGRASLLAGSARAPAMPSLAGPASTRWVSTRPVPTAGVRSSNRPVSSRPMSSCPVSGQLVPSSGVQPSGRLVSVRPVPFSSVAARRWPWGSRRGAGNLAAGTDRVAGGLRVPSGLVDGPSRPGGGDAVVVGRWGSGGRGPGRVGLGRRLRPCSTADRPGGGQPGVRVAGGCRLSQAWERGSKPGVPAPECGRHLGLEHDYAAWSLWSLMARWTGLEGANELDGADGARPQRGPARKSATPARGRQRCDLQELWWARQGLNL
jgi:hypothetical protein